MGSSPISFTCCATSRASISDRVSKINSSLEAKSSGPGSLKSTGRKRFYKRKGRIVSY